MCLLGLAVAARAQTVAPTGGVGGTVTAQNGSLVMPGADVVLLDPAGQTVATAVAGEDGRFQFLGLAAGPYRVEAAVEGFRRTSAAVSVRPGRATEVGLDLPLAPIDQVVFVTPGTEPGGVGVNANSRPGSVDAQTIDEVGGIPGAMRLLAGVFQTPAGLSIRGGRPTQSGLLLGNADVTDPAAGAGPFRLPTDAVASIDVFANPGAVEFGRFSTGVAILGTRQGTDQWRGRLNNFMPSLRTQRQRPLDIIGVERFSPRLTAGGPIVKDRVLVSESVEYRYEDLNSWSRPRSDVMRGRAINTFSRVDATIADGHRLTGSLTLLAHEASAVNMDAFTPPETAATIREAGANVVVSDSLVISLSTALESAVHMSRYTQDVSPSNDNSQGLDLAPQSNSGRFFQTANRETSTWQWIETLSRMFASSLGEHLVKTGVDLLHVSFNGTVNSAPVTIRRVDGAIARRQTFDGPATQAVSSTDIALFAEDRWQLSNRLRLEGGGRIDRDGALGVANGSLRLGGVLVLTAAGTPVVRGGWGRFYDRTPSMVGAFGQLDVATDVRFAPDGATMLAPPARLGHRVDGRLGTPRSDMWNAGIEQQAGSRLTVQANYFNRQGSHEFIVQPVSAAGNTTLALSSRGRSTYRDIEVSADYASPRRTLQVRASYTRSVAEADTNAYLSVFGVLLAPVVPANTFGRADVDVPQRFVSRVRYAPEARWLISPVVEFRSGAPYTPVDEYLDVVPLPERPRFPSVTLVDLRVERLVKVLKWRPWIGVSCNNLFNAFEPAEVQRNITSPQFGGFAGGRPRQFHLLMRFN